MRENPLGALWRFALYATVCAMIIVLLFAVFGQLRFFQTAKNYYAEFADVSGLRAGNPVSIAGVEVGKVQSISLNDDSTVRVEFSTDDTVVLTAGSRAAVRYKDLLGARYLTLEEGAGAADRLVPGATIPLGQTERALDMNALIGGFRPLFRALDPEQVNALSGQLIAAFQGQGPTIGSFLSRAAALTGTLADRDQLIGEVIDNLNALLGSLGGQSDQFAKAVDSLTQLMDGLQARKQDISNGLAYSSSAARSIADLLAQARPPLQKVVPEVDRIAGTVVADHEFVDHLLATLPDTYRRAGRLGLYGDYFSFYMCDRILKVNGKGGQPVYVKLASQSTGRCAPR